ncbi:uncharacterized protein LY89DRAFT_730396 [Mollisia scopiformis]|uniref:Uncharacterized protein n=1 Tax=Mollisia scopiformis TaxID=149040 RepID=A0A194XJL6_MOLSC|nr:uncharacterized protein LY89DRAFT_730396 [Mollisia scopiformis]KUJ20348.1 hypothetical protein LY89DRAFT_730396 [Mollisia scopiformis]
MSFPTTLSSEKPSNSNIEPNPATEPSTSSASQTITTDTAKPKSEAEEAADRLYEERIEEDAGAGGVGMTPERIIVLSLIPLRLLSLTE